MESVNTSAEAQSPESEMIGVQKNMKCVQCGRELNPAVDSACPGCGFVWADYTKSGGNELEPGTVLHGFEIIKKLGSGGMGTVYLAEQKSMQRQIALKILNPSVTKDAAAVEQFLNEVRNTGKINHPNIVNAFDAGCENGTYYLAMQYIKGDTLDHLLQKNGAMKEIQALEVGLQIAQALEYVWSKYQIFHRDIKPGNFMFDEDRKAMLMDLGIAQTIGDANGDEESIEGSPYYMSPEQIQGKALSWTTDLYSLGASLYQMIVGVPPYDDKVIEEILKKHCLSEFPVPVERNPKCQISPETVALLKKMMAKEPGKRFPSWTAFIQELTSLIALLKEIEKNPEKRLEIDAEAAAKAEMERLARKKKINRIVSLSVTIVLLVLVVGGYFLLSSSNTADAEAMKSKLEESYQEFRRNPATYQEFENILKQAERAANALGVPEELAAPLKQNVEKYEKDARNLYERYTKFEELARTFVRKMQEAETKINAIKRSSAIKYDDIATVDGLLENLTGDLKRFVPATPAQKKKLEEGPQGFKNKLQVLKNSLKACRELLKKQDEQRTQAEIKRLQQQQAAQQAATARQVAAELSQKEADARAAVARADDERKRAAEKAEREAERRRREQQQAAVSKVDVLGLIKKEHARIKQEFEDAFIRVDLKRATEIRIAPELSAHQMNAAAKAAFQKLQADYEANHKVAQDAYDCWKELFDVQNGPIFRDCPVDRTSLNRGRGPLYVDKLENGKVYFKDPAAREEDFFFLALKDKEELARRLIMRKPELHSKAVNFYFAIGLYNLARKLTPNTEHKQLIARARDILKKQHQLAKKRGDIRKLEQLRDDYKFR